MKKVVLITGANGNVARKLSNYLTEEYTLRFLTRSKKEKNEFEWNLENKTIDINALLDTDYIIHLAGASITEKKWTQERKEVILSSRVDSAKLINDTLAKNNLKVKAFISASAVGYYGSHTSDMIYTEHDKKGKDFLSDVCYEWEKAADSFQIQKTAERVVKLRFGLVLSNSPDGPLNKLKKLVQFYAGAALGSGKQYMPWIHIDDLCRLIKYSIENENIDDVYNAVAPEYIINKEFIHTIGQVLKKRILLPNIPNIFIELALGEISHLLLEGSRVSSEKILNSGFHFKYPELKPALEDLLL